MWKEFARPFVMATERKGQAPPIDQKFILITVANHDLQSCKLTLVSVIPYPLTALGHQLLGAVGLLFLQNYQRDPAEDGEGG